MKRRSAILAVLFATSAFGAALAQAPAPGAGAPPTGPAAQSPGREGPPGGPNGNPASARPSGPPPAAAQAPPVSPLPNQGPVSPPAAPNAGSPRADGPSVRPAPSSEQRPQAPMRPDAAPSARPDAPPAARPDMAPAARPDRSPRAAAGPRGDRDFDRRPPPREPRYEDRGPRRHGYGRRAYEAPDCRIVRRWIETRYGPRRVTRRVCY